jgi:hypothetical protein
MVEVACTRIQQALPQDHEIDDISCEDNVFEIGVFDATICPGGSQVGLFRFYRHAGETDEELAIRFEDTITNYTNEWRKKS